MGHSECLKRMSTTQLKAQGKKGNTWTFIEDDVLIDSLRALSRDGIWQSDATLNDELLALLQILMETQLPGWKTKSRQEILGRANWLKKRYYALTEMISEAGFGWDEDHMMLVGDRVQYKEWAKSNKPARGLYRVPFHHYYSLEKLYAKRSCSGDSVETEHSDTQNLIESEDENLSIELRSLPGINVRTEEPICDDKQPQSQQVRCREYWQDFDRRVRSKVEDEMSANTAIMAASIAAMGLKIGGLGRKVDNLINVLSDDGKCVADLQEKLIDELNRVEGLEDFQVFRTINMLATKHDLLRVFFTMPEDMKKSYVLDLIRFES